MGKWIRRDVDVHRQDVPDFQYTGQLDYVEDMGDMPRYIKHHVKWFMRNTMRVFDKRMDAIRREFQ